MGVNSLGSAICAWGRLRDAVRAKTSKLVQRPAGSRLGINSDSGCGIRIRGVLFRSDPRCDLDRRGHSKQHLVRRHPAGGLRAGHDRAPADSAALWDRFDLGQKPWLRGRTLGFGRLRLHTTSLIAGVLIVLVGVLFLRFDGTAGLTGFLGVGDTTDAEFAIQEKITEWAAY